MNKKILKTVLFLMLAATISVAIPAVKVSASTVINVSVNCAATTNGWVQSGGNWYYYTNGTKAVGWKKISNDWYYFESNGVMVTGWRKIGSDWYYFKDYGMMHTGYLKLDGSVYYFDHETGAMVTGWNKQYWYGEQKWFYYYPSGKRAYGWCMVDGKWYYLDSTDGYMYENCVERIYGKYYRFDVSGAMKTNNWYYDSEKDGWYYFGSSGMAVSGLQWIGGKLYSFDGTDFTMDTNILTSAYGNNCCYRFKNDGSAYMNEWDYNSDGTRCRYYDFNCESHEGIVEVDGVRYFIGYWGLECGKFKYNNVDYVAHEDGSVSYGFVQVNDWRGNYWYFTDENGVMQNGWIKYNKSWYYFSPYDGRMYADTTVEIDGVDYVFHSNGKLYINEWYNEGDDWYYLDSRGRYHEGWLEYKGSWYYFGREYDYIYYPTMYRDSFLDFKGERYLFASDGKMVTGWYSMGNTWHCHDEEGRQITGWYKYKGDWYYFREGYGDMLTNTRVEGYYLGRDGRYQPGV